MRDERALVHDRSRYSGVVPGSQAGIGRIFGSRGPGAQAVAGRLAVRAEQVDVRIVAADGILPRLAVIIGIDVPPLIVVGESGLQVDRPTLAEGHIAADALGRGLAPLVLYVDAAATR